MYVIRITPLAALPNTVSQVLDYFWPDPLPEGSLAKVMIGRRPAVGLVLESLDLSCLYGEMAPPALEADSFRFLEQARVPYMVQYMWGGPGETRETILENFRQAARWKAVMSMASYGLRILPGAGLFAVARREGVVDDSTDLLEPTFYLSEPLRDDREWLDLQVKRMNRFRLHALPSRDRLPRCARPFPHRRGRHRTRHRMPASAPP